MNGKGCSGKMVLVIDDERSIRESISDYLEDIGCCPSQASDGASAIRMIETSSFDAVVVDLTMPGIDGYDVVKYAASTKPEMPVIVLSGIGIIDRAVESIRYGAWDYIPKPLSRMEVLGMALGRGFERAGLLKENRMYKEHLEEEVEKKTALILSLSSEMIRTQKEIILTLGDVVETRSHETAHHVDRVSEFAYLLALRAGLDESAASELRIAAPMHDVGKIGIPDTILNKPGLLTSDEMDMMKSHTIIGHSIFKNSSLPALALAAEVALCHHERWDGRGYPNGLRADSIPLGARITSIADVFDAVSHERVYKKAWDIDRSFSYIAENGGTFFDPRLTDTFVNIRSEVMAIFHKFRD